MRNSQRLSGIVIIALILCIGFIAIGAENARAGLSPCTVVVEKVEIPDTGTEFEFTSTKENASEFTLVNGQTFGVGVGIEQTVNIAEIVPSGYVVESIVCDGGEDTCGEVPCLDISIGSESLSATCLDDEVRTCAFTNVLTAAEVPTISEWGLIAMAGFLGLIAFFAIRRKKAVA